MSAQPIVESVQTGSVAPLGPDRVPSGFVKRAVAGVVRVRRLGIEGDAQADLRVHGGPEKAVYAYAAAHYPRWKADEPHHTGRLVHGAFGENLTIAGLEERDLCVGDVHGIGSVRLQVCQPRQPCFKFALHFEDTRMPRAMVQNGRAGWYYRVIEEGELVAGDTVRVLDRPNPGLPFSRMIDIIYLRGVTRDDLAALAAADGAPEGLRDQARRKLETQLTQ